MSPLQYRSSWTSAHLPTSDFPPFSPIAPLSSSIQVVLCSPSPHSLLFSFSLHFHLLLRFLFSPPLPIAVPFVLLHLAPPLLPFSHLPVPPHLHTLYKSYFHPLPFPLFLYPTIHPYPSLPARLISPFPSPIPSLSPTLPPISATSPSYSPSTSILSKCPFSATLLFPPSHSPIHFRSTFSVSTP